MITNAIKILEDDQWVQSHKDHPGEPEDKAQFIQNMLAAYEERKTRLEDIATQLGAMDLPVEAKTIIDAALTEARRRFSVMEQYVAKSRDEGYPHTAAVWYGCVQQPDLDARAMLGGAHKQLQQLQARLVEGTVSDAR